MWHTLRRFVLIEMYYKFVLNTEHESRFNVSLHE